MNIKKIKILGLFLVFLLCFPLHFLYEWMPNSVFSIFLPVNESIWEHMKLVSTSFILYGIIDFILLKKYTNFNNFLLQLFIVPLIGIILFLIIYLPIFNILGENIFLNILILGIVIFIEELLSYFILNIKEIKYGSVIGVIGIIIIYIIFGYLTYKPMINYIFFDTKNEKYGINTYLFD